jgi:hypothetical protein
MLAFEGESKLRAGFTSDFVGGHHLPQMLVNPKFYLFAQHVIFYFLLPNQPFLRWWLMPSISFNSLMQLTHFSLSNVHLLTVQQMR